MIDRILAGLDGLSTDKLRSYLSNIVNPMLDMIETEAGNEFRYYVSAWSKTAPEEFRRTEPVGESDANELGRLRPTPTDVANRLIIACSTVISRSKVDPNWLEFAKSHLRETYNVSLGDRLTVARALAARNASKPELRQPLP